jgi:hypothetical protein
MPGPKQKADGKEHFKVLQPIGLLINKPLAFGGPLICHPTVSIFTPSKFNAILTPKSN